MVTSPGVYIDTHVCDGTVVSLYNYNNNYYCNYTIEERNNMQF